MREQPWAYQEAKDRIREAREREDREREQLSEHFERQKALLQRHKRLGIFELKRRIETGHSLESLRTEIQNALQEGVISRETFEELQHSLRVSEWGIEEFDADTENLPFSQTAFAKWLEKKRLWEHIWADIVWFLYGFVIQWGALAVILVWRVLHDLIFLPRDIYDSFHDHS